jgi:hypothetical protein
MRHLWVVLLALTATAASAQDHDHDKKVVGKIEVRVYIADQDKKAIDPKDVSATLVLEPKGGTKKTLKMDLVSPKGDKKAGIGHGGEVQESDGFHVELVVVKPGAHGKEEKGHDDHKDDDATPYFKAEADLKESELSAVVIFKVKGDTHNAKGFAYPSATPGSYKDAVAKIEEHLKAIDALIGANDLDKVHKVAEKISEICEKLPAMAPKDDQAEVAKTCKEIIALFKEIDDAADGGKKAETVKVVEKYRAKVAILKKHA